MCHSENIYSDKHKKHWGNIVLIFFIVFVDAPLDILSLHIPDEP